MACNSLRGLMVGPLDQDNDSLAFLWQFGIAK